MSGTRGPMNTTDAAVNDGFIYPTDGMSIRDHFAGLAMQSTIIANHPDGSIESDVAGAYRYADAMLRAREASQ